MKTIYISYRVSLLNKRKEEQVLSRFNGYLDFIHVIKEFCDYTLENIKSYYDPQGNSRTFSLNRLAKISLKERIVYGDFESGFTGDEVLVKDNKNNNLLFDVHTKHLQARKLLFLFYIPKGSKYGYLILQKKNNHGVKTVLLNALNEFLKIKGYTDYLSTFVPSSNFKKMIEGLRFGKIKQVKFKSFSSGLMAKNIQINSFFKNNISELIVKPSKNEDLIRQREILLSLFSNNYEFDDLIFIPGISQGCIEISFLVNYQGISKTYYIKEKSKIKSNINVSNKLSYENGYPTRESMIIVALEIAKSFFNNDDSDLAA
ncbi:hypothetical protein [Kordia sp.]|uniref:hypothetical protein n=1 Tax=Kordia sp. TaxID=1965332 RepID=UPI003D6AE055